MMLLFVAGAWADELTFGPADFSAATSAATSATKSPITIEVSSGTITTEQIRIFKNQTITISASGVNITSVVFTCTASGTAQYGPGCFTNVGETGTYEASEGNTGTWTGNAESLQLKASSNQVRATSIVVTYVGSSDTKTATTIEFSGDYQTRFTYGANGESVALPTATVKAGDTTVGTAVAWELTKGSDFRVGDAEPVIDGNVVKPSNHSYGKLTLKASYAGDATYKASTKSYTLTVYKGYMSLAEVVEDFMKDNSKFTSTGIPVSYWAMINEETAGTATVTYANGSYTYISDGQNDLLLYGSGLGLEKGDVISNDKGNGQGFDAIYGMMKTYNGLLELGTSKDEMQFTVKSKGAEVTPKTLDIANIGDVKNMNAYLKVENAEYVSASGKNLTFKVGDAELSVYNQWSVGIDALEAGAKYTLTGMGSIYAKNDQVTYQLYLIDFTKTAEPAGINAIQAEAQQGKVYNLQGQRVEKATKGLYIVGGKKIVVK